MVKVPTGGRKKKLNRAVAAIALTSATRNPQNAEVIRTTTRNVRAAVVGFTGRNRRYSTVTAASPAAAAIMRASKSLRDIPVAIVLFTGNLFPTAYNERQMQKSPEEWLDAVAPAKTRGVF